MRGDNRQTGLFATIIDVFQNLFRTFAGKISNEQFKLIQMKRVLTSLAFSIYCCVMSVAQTYVTDRHIGIENGLSNNFIQDIVIDKRGFAWVGTESGVNRIAGNTVTVFRSQDADAGRGHIIGNEIRSLHYDEPSDKVMIATEKGLSVFECKNERFYNLTVDNGLPYPVINDIAYASPHEVWLVTSKGHVIRMNCETYACQVVTKLNGVRSIMDDGNGHIYLGHQLRDGLSIVTLKDLSTKNYRFVEGDPESLPGNNVRCIYQDHLKNVWVGTNMGLALFDAKSGTFRKVARKGVQTDDNVFDIQEMPDGQLWVASDMGGISVVDLNHFSPSAPITYSDDVNVRLTSINTRSIERDSYGNIWIGNYSTGVDFISATKPTFHILPNFNADHQQKRVYGLAGDGEGNIWLGGEDELTLCREGKVIRSWPLNRVMNRSHSFVMSLMTDSRKNVWLGIEDDGIVKFNTVTKQMERIDIGHPVADIRALYEAADGTVWIGSELGLYTYKDGRVARPRLENEVLGHSVVFSIAEMDSLMLMGTYAAGLLVFNRETGTYRQLSVDGGLPGRNINQILIDHEGGLWMAMPEGLFYLKDIHRFSELMAYDEHNGLADRHVRAIQEDRSGRIWVSTYSGIACLDRDKGQFYNYNHQSSLPPGSYIQGSAATAPDGTMYFGSPTGVCYFNPQLQSNDFHVSDALITVCEAYNPTGEDTEILYLMPDEAGRVYTNYEQNTLRIAFTVKDYSQVGNVEYAYQMKGLNDEWYYIGNDFDVAFRGLSPGTYTFILRAKLKNQDWSDASTAQLTIRITPPFWRTWWAYLIYILLAGAIVWYLLRNYKHKLQLENSLELERRESLQKQDLNEERLRFFTNITHELRTPLTLILGPLEDLVSDNRLPEPYRRKVELISKSAGRLRDLINQILEFRKTETQNRRLTVAKGDLGAQVKEIGQYFKQLNRNLKVAIHVIVRPDLPPIYFDSEVITTILNNLLSNAIKYTDEGSIDLVMNADGKGHIYIMVKDTGYGIDREALPHIFDRYYQVRGEHQASGTGIGLALVKSLADLHEGTLTVESKPGEGSKFTFSLLIDNTYPHALHKEDEKEVNSEELTANSEGMAETADDERPMLLVVEDNDDIRQYIADSMGDDYQVIQANNGYEGTMLAMEQIPDIIVSDIMMPKMNGIELTRRVKEDVRTSHIPVILLTAKDSIEDKEEGYDSGADSYLTKPFSARLLQSRIQNLLSTRRKLAELLTFRSQAADGASLSDEPKLNRLDQEFMDKLNKTIEENIMQEDLDMAFMTDKMAMSHSTFYRKVKALTGMTAKEYIRKLRLQRAAQLLSKGEYNVTEAATMTGFNDLGNFRIIFKKEFGVTPSDYSKR